MVFWLTQQGSRLLIYAAEILLNALILWGLLNRMAPPRMVIEDPATPDSKPTLRRYRHFPLHKCVFCSLLLFGMTLFAAAPLFILKAARGTTGYDIRGVPLFLVLWFFGSRWAVSTVFAGTRAHHYAIFIIYIAVSFAVEWAIGLIA